MTRIMLRSLVRSPPSVVQPISTETAQHNQVVLQNSNVSHVNLPPMFIVWRHSNPERSIRVNGLTHEQSFCAVCIVSERMNGSIHPLWKLTLVEQPLEALGRCQVGFHPDRWLSGQDHTILVNRQSPKPEANNKLFSTSICHSRYGIRLESGQIVPILKMSDPCLVLQAHFTRVDTQYMDTFGFVCDHGRELIPTTLIRRAELQREALQMAQRAGRTLIEFAQEPTPSVPAQPPVPSIPVLPRHVVPATAAIRSVRLPQVQSIRQVMPQHIVNTVIESLVAQEKECPILQTPLTKEETCLTPCGHAMTTDAATRWIRGAHSCPECRSHCSVDQLQVWRA